MCVAFLYAQSIMPVIYLYTYPGDWIWRLTEVISLAQKIAEGMRQEYTPWILIPAICFTNHFFLGGSSMWKAVKKYFFKSTSKIYQNNYVSWYSWGYSLLLVSSFFVDKPKELKVKKSCMSPTPADFVFVWIDKKYKKWRGKSNRTQELSHISCFQQQ